MNTYPSPSKRLLTVLVMLAVCIAVLNGCDRKDESAAANARAQVAARTDAPAPAPSPDAMSKSSAPAPAPRPPATSAAKTPTPIGNPQGVPVSSPGETLPPPSPTSSPDASPPPPIPPRTPTSAIGGVDRILATMDWANIAFNSPSTIKLDETAQLQLLLSLQKSIEELSRAIVEAGAREGAKVKVSNRMEARLSGPTFQITAITTEEQAIGSVDTIEWKWEIKPTVAGRHNLHLTLTALINVDGAATRSSVRTFNRTIEVEVTARQRALEFVEKNWQWLWAAILLPIAGWLWKRWKDQRGTTK